MACALATSLLLLTACGSDTPATSSSTAPATTAPATTAAATSASAAGGNGPASSASGAAALGVGDTSLGSVVVDGTGMTAYIFTKDTAGSGSSSCAGDCATAWPAIHADSATPEVDGVTGTVGTITGTDGELQVTLDGLPLYTFAKDAAPGDVNGQGVNGVWFVVGADGAPVGMSSAAPTS
ncbi:hypothetical protein GIS00_20855 [Nakamurella sp. YIM 132087]|uniref:Lipoprotein n=2 Tax=Nakamurella alba TaxID=2665158 RepID=A0A7K1FU84_9ACTN|nr:hypothetical protein [Nakamurella alba]